MQAAEHSVWNPLLVCREPFLEPAGRQWIGGCILGHAELPRDCWSAGCFWGCERTVSWIAAASSRCWLGFPTTPLKGVCSMGGFVVCALTSKMSFLCRAWEHRDNFQCWAAVPRVLLVLGRCGWSLRSQLSVSEQRLPWGHPKGTLGETTERRAGRRGTRSWRRKVTVWGNRGSFAAQRALREVHSGGEGLASSLVTP